MTETYVIKHAQTHTHTHARTSTHRETDRQTDREREREAARQAEWHQESGKTCLLVRVCLCRPISSPLESLLTLSLRQHGRHHPIILYYTPSPGHYEPLFFRKARHTLLPSVSLPISLLCSLPSSLFLVSFVHSLRIRTFCSLQLLSPVRSATPPRESSPRPRSLSPWPSPPPSTAAPGTFDHCTITHNVNLSLWISVALSACCSVSFLCSLLLSLLSSSPS